MYLLCDRQFFFLATSKIHMDLRAVPLINSWEVFDSFSVTFLCDGIFGRRGAITSKVNPIICGIRYTYLKKRNILHVMLEFSSDYARIL